MKTPLPEPGAPLGHFVSDNLLTPPPPEVDDDARAQTVLKVATDWTAKFPELSAPLGILRERLSP